MKFSIPALVLCAAAFLLLAPPASAEYTVYQIQLGTVPVNSIVECDGVVVTAVGFWGYFVQEPVPDPTYGRKYSGIWCYSNAAHTIHKGDIVNVKGKYREYNGFSEIDIPAGAGFTQYVGSGTVPDPVPVRIAEVNDTGVDAEAYESVFIKVDRTDNTLYSYAMNSFNEWYIRTNSDGTGDSLLVDQYSAKPGDDFEYDVPTPGTLFTFLQGVLVYNYNQFKIAPRNCEVDMGVPGCKPKLRGAYCTSNTALNVQFGVAVEQASAENPGNYGLASGYAILSAQRDAVNHKVVHLTTELLPDAEPDQIMVSGVRSENGGIMMDPNQTFNFRLGITPIYNIQFVSSPPTNDASPLLNEVVTIEGRVTALENNYYYLQDGDGGAWRGLYSRVSKSGDVAVGDLIQVSGQVNEYNGDTELGYRSGCDNFRVLGHPTTPLHVNVVTPAQIPFRGVALTAEPYESGLVRMNNAILQDSIPGMGGPYYHEYPMRVQSIPDTSRCKLDGLGTIVSYDACPGNVVNITGVLHYAYGMYQLYPRSGRGGDIIEVSHAQGCPTTSVEDAANAALMLDQNRPNPFGPVTDIRFSLSVPSTVRLEVIDAAGRLVRTLASGSLPAGDHSYRWDGSNSDGRFVGAGTYFYRLRSGGKEMSRKMVLMP